jgi:plasmid stability protein
VKQQTMFAADETEPKKYSAKIEAPVYEPKNPQPHLMTLCDDSKTKRLITEINESNLPDDAKAFLRAAAHRHSVFHYERIADYYAHASAEMQALMEKSALVIIDFDAAIENGFVKLCEEIKTQFLEEYNEPTP